MHFWAWQVEAAIGPLGSNTHLVSEQRQPCCFPGREWKRRGGREVSAVWSDWQECHVGCASALATPSNHLSSWQLCHYQEARCTVTCPSMLAALDSRLGASCQWTPCIFPVWLLSLLVRDIASSPSNTSGISSISQYRGGQPFFSWGQSVRGHQWVKGSGEQD